MRPVGVDREVLKDALPPLHDQPRSFWCRKDVFAVLFDVASGALGPVHLMFEEGDRRAVGSANLRVQRRRVRTRVECCDGILKNERVQGSPVFNHRQGNGGRADFEEVCDVAAVGFAADQVQTVKRVVRGVRLVAQVHQRATVRGFDPAHALEESSPWAARVVPPLPVPEDQTADSREDGARR